MCVDGKCGHFTKPGDKAALVKNLEVLSAAVVVKTLHEAGVPFDKSPAVLARALSGVVFSRADGDPAKVKEEAEKVKDLFDRYVTESLPSYQKWQAEGRPGPEAYL